MLDKTKSIGSVVLLFAIWLAGLALVIALGRLIKFLPPGISDILCVGAFILFVVFMLPTIRDQVKTHGAVNVLPSLELLLGLVFVILFWLGLYKLANLVISRASAWFQRLPFATQDYCCGGALVVLVALLGLLIFRSNKRGGQAERL